MPYLPQLPENRVERIHTETFSGYNHNLKIGTNEFFDMENLSGDQYPALSSRKKRGIVSGDLSNVQGMIAKDALAFINNGTLYYNGSPVSGLVLSQSGEKQLVSMGAYICIFPDKKYFNTEDQTDYGSMESSFSAGQSVAVTFAPCDINGTAYTDITPGENAPSNPNNGDLWLDTSSEAHALNRFSSVQGQWIAIPTVYTKITAPGIGAAFGDGDAITISGASGTASPTNGNKVIMSKTADSVTVVGLIDSASTQTGGLSAARTVPEMDYVCEAGNRLWGCFYGIKDGKTVNEIYASKLGDFKNWNSFQGISTDSWAASIGSDGQWTGAVNYLGYPTFFKEGCLHRVSISSSGAHQLDQTICRGVQKGSHKSLVVVGETLYYKSITDIMAYQGGLPAPISEKLGGVTYYAASAGAIGWKYYISMQNDNDDWHLFCYDTSKGMWHREDETHASAFAQVDDDLYFYDSDAEKIMCVNGTQGTPEEDFYWEAVSGIQYYEDIMRNYVSRYGFRVKLPLGSFLRLYVMYDSDGEWINKGECIGNGISSFVLPVIPRRCDHLQFKISGMGEFSLLSMTRTLENGSDVIL